MEGEVWGCSSREDSDDEAFLQNSDEEEHHFSSGSLPKLQFRSVKSKACWNDEMEMGEVIEKKGKLWVTTGIVRSGKTYSSIEETLYLMELGALHLLDNCDTCISLTDIYRKIAGRNDGCCWELFDVYRHLKSLGYIVGRHGVAWSLKGSKSDHKPVALEGSKDELSINELFSELQINELRPDFDVYLPNNRFRKSSPGDPSFLLHLSRGDPPSRAEIEVLERQCSGIPLKISVVEDGRISFFSFDKVELPVLP
ncbi:tRNA-splicing endonuclease subunit Sen54-like isoform X1 [Senna tora]|uniref:tRNA-splicing endonuclease subunit Sen54-like isoform X1 n=1 Tax=Senna tora TaxID=362788 RepID=A0A834TBM2_9FABA|nr:tRNA-splicing endonuclease subunit Sen54-like isoform X1 [Senna tora]